MARSLRSTFFSIQICAHEMSASRRKRRLPKNVQRWEPDPTQMSKWCTGGVCLSGVDCLVSVDRLPGSFCGGFVMKNSRGEPGLAREERLQEWPAVGELWPVATSFRGHWDALFPSIRNDKMRFLQFPPTTLKPCCLLNNTKHALRWFGCRGKGGASAFFPWRLWFLLWRRWPWLVF